MTRRNVSGNSPWEPIVGFSRAVRMGRHVWVAGTTATGDDGKLVGVRDAHAQTLQAFRNIERALRGAGAALRDVVRTRMYVIRPEDIEAVTRAHHQLFCDVRPAATLVAVKALVSPDMLVEVEVEAYLPEEEGGR